MAAHRSPGAARLHRGALDPPRVPLGRLWAEVAVYPSWEPTQPRTTLRPIVSPGAPPWAVAVRSSAISRETWPWQAGLTLLATAGTVGAVVATMAAPAIGAVLFVLVVAAAVWLFRSAGPCVVSGPGWRYRGLPIAGDGFHLLEDIDGRFAFAEHLIKEIPTGIQWREIAREVQALRWEAAGQAAKLAALDAELSDLRYASAGTPQMALRRQLEERRDEHAVILGDIQRDAEDLARVAGNALAAAKVALARTGDLSRLEVVVPSRRALVAKAALAEAKARLALLADVWAELDDSATLAAEALERGRDSSSEHLDRR